ncbi:hypothetical protein OO015_01640 [Thermomicrobium sp. 4228-Ro]|uniref:hypothetical protein n=1 Tax=Thermomicrobium sp. 4228-Ro TaxID=2993937 RepID=UPI0022499B66|nr:hypothetical protein [Thermomicrobium sp. 4228-Ro]MCX2726202.1 hypothetical protein [Thermomicrobium sp. 4228-Ro]
MSSATPRHQHDAGSIRYDRIDGILDHWRLESLALGGDLSRSAHTRAWNAVLDAILTEIAAHPDSPDPYSAFVEYAVLRGRVADARLLLRTIERQLQIDPSWLHPTTYRTLLWLVESMEPARLIELGWALLDGPAPLRRAFLPSIVAELATTDDATTLSREWRQQYPNEPEAWWTAVAIALEHHDFQYARTLCSDLQLPLTARQSVLAILLLPVLPEEVRWSYLADFLDLFRQRPVPLEPVTKTIERLRATGQLDALLVAALLAYRLGIAFDARELCSLPEPTTPIARALLAGLASLLLAPDDTSAAIRSCFETLLHELREHSATARTVLRLLPTLRPHHVVEFACLLPDDHLAGRIQQMLEGPDFTLHQLDELATRLYERGRIDRAVVLLRLAARRAGQRNDRTNLVRFLRQLARLDPFDDRTLEFVISHDTRTGHYAEAVETLIAAAARANALGDTARRVMLLERAAAIAELADDRGRLAALAELLASSDPDNPDRSVYAATAAVRAGQTERAQAYLWTALRAALRQRRPLDALSIAEQLVALAPEDDAARAHLEELRALRARLQRLNANRADLQAS